MPITRTIPPNTTVASIQQVFSTKNAYFNDSFIGKANAALSISDSGHAYTVSSSNGTQAVIRGGALGYPVGHTPGSGIPYAQPTVALPSACTWVGGMLGWDSSDTVGSSVAIGAFTQLGASGTVSSSMHLAVTPAYCTFSVFNNGVGDFTSLVPEGYDTNAPRFPKAQLCDGSTTYRVDIIIDRQRGKAYVTIGDNPTLVYSDSRISSVDARYPFWEPFSVTSMDNLPRLTKIWADHSGNADVAPQSSVMASSIANSAPKSGAGTITNRFSPRMKPGAQWTVSERTVTLASSASATGTSLSLSGPVRPGTLMAIDTGANLEFRTAGVCTGTGPFAVAVSALTNAHASAAPVVLPSYSTNSDGYAWHDKNGIHVGNQFNPGAGTTHEENVGLSMIGLSRTSVKQPSTSWHQSRVHRFVATSAGTVLAYSNPFFNVTPGEPYAAIVGQMQALTTARTVSPVLRFYTAASVQIGSDITGAGVSVGTSAPVALTTAAGVAPSTAILGAWLVIIGGAAISDVFLMSEPAFSLFDGPVPAAFVRD